MKCDIHIKRNFQKCSLLLIITFIICLESAVCLQINCFCESKLVFLTCDIHIKRNFHFYMYFKLLLMKIFNIKMNFQKLSLLLIITFIICLQSAVCLQKNCFCESNLVFVTCDIHIKRNFHFYMYFELLLMKIFNY